MNKKFVYQVGNNKKETQQDLYEIVILQSHLPEQKI